MFKTIRKTQRFCSNDTEDLAEYDKIINDPLCSIVKSDKEKIKNADTGPDGMTTHREWIEYIVTWEQQVLV